MVWSPREANVVVYIMAGFPGHDRHVTSALHEVYSLLCGLWEVIECLWDSTEFDASLLHDKLKWKHT